MSKISVFLLKFQLLHDVPLKIIGTTLAIGAIPINILTLVYKYRTMKQ